MKRTLSELLALLGTIAAGLSANEFERIRQICTNEIATNVHLKTKLETRFDRDLNHEMTFRLSHSITLASFSRKYSTSSTSIQKYKTR